MTPSKTLLRKKVLYLADHSRGNRLTAGFRTILATFDEGNWVPGFGEVLVVTSLKKLKEFRVAKGMLPERKKRIFSMLVCTPFPVNLKNPPDILWIDDVNLLSAEIDRVVKRFQHLDCHIMYSGKKPKTAKMQLVVDTREQKPLWKGKECKKMTMNCGDYTTEKLFNCFHIERKSLEDLYGTILVGHIRFRKEHLRSIANNINLVLYVEGTKKDFGAKRFNGGHKRQCSGQTLVKIIDSIESRWPLEVVWCGSRLKAKKMIYQRLQKEERRIK